MVSNLLLHNDVRMSATRPATVFFARADRQI
jgi:hypothetical protein